MACRQRGQGPIGLVPFGAGSGPFGPGRGWLTKNNIFIFPLRPGPFSYEGLTSP